MTALDLKDYLSNSVGEGLVEPAIKSRLPLIKEKCLNNSSYQGAGVPYSMIDRTGCSGKIEFFFTIHCYPFLAYIAVKDLQSSQRNASVQSLLLAGNFFVQPIAAECWRGRGGKLSRNLGKKTQYLMNTLYLHIRDFNLSRRQRKTTFQSFLILVLHQENLFLSYIRNI